jgi:hypothetical protein
MRLPLCSSLVLLVLVGGFRVGTAWAQPAEEIDFDCEPVHLYRGDILAVNFHSPHDDAELAVMNEDGDTILV